MSSGDRTRRKAVTKVGLIVIFVTSEALKNIGFAVGKSVIPSQRFWTFFIEG